MYFVLISLTVVYNYLINIFLSGFCHDVLQFQQTFKGLGSLRGAVRGPTGMAGLPNTLGEARQRASYRNGGSTRPGERRTLLAEWHRTRHFLGCTGGGRW